MTPRERLIAALERRPFTGRVPHFELVFFLTMEAFGRVHPLQRSYTQWLQMTDHERNLHRADIADLFVTTAGRYEHSGIFLHPSPYSEDEERRLIDLVREQSGDTYFLMVHGDATYAMPSGDDMMEWVAWVCENLDEAKSKADEKVNAMLEKAERQMKHGGLDGYALCSDYCFNDNPFLSPDLFDEVITPYLAKLCRGLRDLGFYVIKHTDGNILPIIDRLVEANPHALHSLDPQGGVDIADIKRRYGDRVCLIGNVDCGVLNSGTEDAAIASARYCIEHGMPGGGYVFSTSNCVYTGLPLDRYELIWRVWHDEAIYPETSNTFACTGGSTA